MLASTTPERHADLREAAVEAAVRSGGALSIASSAAPPHCPPTARPGRTAARPAVSGASRRPGIAWAAARSGSSPAPSASSRRPARACGRSRSPKWPNTTPPNGRAMKPTAKVLNAAIWRDERRQVGREEQLGEHQRRGGAVDEEVVPLDRGAGGGDRDDLDRQAALAAEACAGRAAALLSPSIQSNATDAGVRLRGLLIAHRQR